VCWTAGRRLAATGAIWPNRFSNATRK
jgi:hypothetical protein